MRRLSLALLTGAALLLCEPLTAAATIYPGYHQIMNRQDGLCLDVTGAAMEDGANVGVWRCVNADNQRWEPLGLYFGVWEYSAKLRVAHSGKCLSVQWRSSTEGNGSNVVQDDCSRAPRWHFVELRTGWTQVWTWADAGPGHWVSKCLDKSGWDTTVWDCWMPYWQQWNSSG